MVNVGIPTVLLDIIPKTLTSEEESMGLTLESKQVRNRFSSSAVQKLFKQKPAPLTAKENATLITVGNLEDDMRLLEDADWIIEVVVENLAIKKASI
ncbi:hypothetical protein GCM10020331_028150 [Ectobacillus funiculus]